MKRIAAFTISVLIMLFSAHTAYSDDFIEEDPFEPVFTDVKSGPGEPSINAGYAIVIDAESGRVLYEKNAHKRTPMASTTKIMTAVVAIENGRLDDVVTVSKRAAGIWGSKIHLKAGQKITLRELLYGLLISSGNDAAIAIAEHLGGTVENYIDMMNRKARELGLKDTNFKTPHGLDADGHYTTAYELACMTRYALQNPVFSEIVKTKNTSISYRTLNNTNEMLRAYPGADGVKTGYTGKAGRCLVTSVTREGGRFISVVINSPSRYARALSSKLILDYAYNNYKTYTLMRAGEIVRSIGVSKGIDNSVAVESMDEVRMPLRKEEIDAMEMAVELPKIIDAPVYKNIEVGCVKFIINGEVIAKTQLKTCADVRRKTAREYLGDIFKMWGRTIHEGMFLDI
jgi:D-alanyl-D-alanine carboxypeptidase (penicillin-binding protein 5/6)